MQEINPLLGVTAIGQGILNGRIVDIHYTTTLQTQGRRHSRYRLMVGK
jgi:hypothetical protein